jgi:Fe-S cluster assembly protein SufD
MGTLSPSQWWPQATTALQATRPAPAWPELEASRAQALACLSELALPTRQDEAWRATPLAPLLAVPLAPAPKAPQPLMPAISRFLLAQAKGRRLVFVDGRFAPNLSDLSDLPEGLRLGPASHHPDLASSVASSLAVDEARPLPDAFDALHEAAVEDAMVLDLAPGVKVPGSVQLLLVGGAGQPAPGVAPLVAARVLVRLGQGSELNLVEEHVSLDEPHFVGVNRVEVSLGRGACLRHTRVLSESRAGVHLTRLRAQLPRDARYHVQSVALGARLSRTEKRLHLTEAGSEAHLDGLALVAGRQLADVHTAIFHEAPQAQSRQRFKAIASEQAVAVFDGLIHVRPGADGTDSAQQARGLLLDPAARLDVKPQLEIFADDVKAAHGAAVGQLDAEQLFYLQSRGLSASASRKLLTYAFAAEVLDAIPDPELRAQLANVVLRQTAQGGAP